MYGALRKESGRFTLQGPRPLMVDIPEIDELLLNFDSLGDNCEFGILQRQAGLEPLGLFRFSFTPMPSLLRGLACRFSDLAEPERIEITIAGNKEMVVKILDYNFTYHTGRHEGDITIEALRKEEKTKLGFLIRRLMGTLKSGEKILVRKGQNTKTLEDAQTLLAALREHGPATLLWVLEADSYNPSGSVQLVAPNLICGRIDGFAPYDDAHSVSFSDWIHVCRGAYEMWQTPPPVATTILPPQRDNQTANLLYLDQPEPVDLPMRKLIVQRDGISVDVDSGTFPARDPNNPTILWHSLEGVTKGIIGIRVTGLTAGAPYTFSMWIKLEPGRQRLETATLMFPGNKQMRRRGISVGTREVWQRLEVTGIAPKDGIMFPRLLVKGPNGIGFSTANWRLEAGLMVDADEDPSLAEIGAAPEKMLQAGH